MGTPVCASFWLTLPRPSSKANSTPAGALPGTRITDEDEIVVVLEGNLVVDDGERHELGPGDAYALPRGVRHAFANESESLTRLYFFCSPGGLERFFRDLTSGVPPAEAALRADLVFE